MVLTEAEKEQLEAKGYGIREKEIYRFAKDEDARKVGDIDPEGNIIITYFPIYDLNLFLDFRDELKKRGIHYLHPSKDKTDAKGWLDSEIVISKKETERFQELEKRLLED